MIFNVAHLNGIKSGNITLAFRKWEKASVKNGSMIKTALGVIKIGDVEKVQPKQVTDSDAQQAGYKNRQELLDHLKAPEGSIFRIGVSYHSEDPRIALRSREELTDELFTAISSKLEKFDKLSNAGPWTRKTLTTIQRHPHTRAMDIADMTGFEKDWLKINIRKLKNIGLTISHEVGYEISPFGKRFLERWIEEKSK